MVELEFGVGEGIRILHYIKDLYNTQQFLLKLY